MTYETPTEGNNKTLYIIIAVVAAVLLLCCCVVVIGAVVLQTTGTVSLPFMGPSLSETFESDDDYNVEFNYPDDWYAEGDYGYYYIGTVRDVEDMDEPEEGEFYMSMYFESTDWGDWDSPEEAMEEMLDDMLYYEEDLEVSDIKSMKVGGNDGVYVTLEGESEDFDAEIDGQIVIWEVESDYYGVAVGITGGANFSKFKGTMNAILDSVITDIDY